MIRVCGVAVLIGLGCGCFDFKQELVLDASGGGRFEQRMTVLPKTAVLMREFAPPARMQALMDSVVPKLNGADKRGLAEAGLSGVKFTRPGKEFSVGVAAKFGALSALGGLANVGMPVMGFVLEPVGNGAPGDVWELRPVPAAGRGGDAFSKLVDPLADADPDIPPDRALELLGGVMGELGQMKLVFSVEVPGRIVEAVPDSGLVVDGDRATWTIDLKSLFPDGEQAGLAELFGGAMGGGGLGGGLGEPSFGDDLPELPGMLDPSEIRLRFIPDRAFPPDVGAR
jgi:hypothetical protein